jgi:hypothetical protein
LDFNDFLADCDDVLMGLELDGVLQVADFHPRYQFGGTDDDDIPLAFRGELGEKALRVGLSDQFLRHRVFLPS